jgi:hypothetical protein
MLTKSFALVTSFASFVFYSLGLFSFLSDEFSDSTGKGFIVAGSCLFFSSILAYFAAKDTCRLARHNEESLKALREEIEKDYLRRRPRLK